MASSRRTYLRRQQQSLRLHRFKLESLEKRYALDGDNLSISMNAEYVAAGINFPTDYSSASLVDIGKPISYFLPDQNLVSFASVTDATPGMVITSLDLNGGELWYSVNSGTTWVEITSASENSGTVLIDDGNTRLHYEPPANHSSRLADVFTFEAYDFASNMVSGTSQVDASTGSSSQPVGSYVIDHTMYPGTLGDGGKIKLFSDGTRAAAIHDDGLEILDVSNPSSIQRIGIMPSASEEVEGLLSDVHIAGDESSVFINPTAPSTNGAFVVDLSNQSAPQLLPYNANTFAWTVTSSSNGSMVILGSTGGPEGQSFSNLHFFDTTNRASPQLLSSLNLTIPAATFGTPPYEFTAESDLEVHGITISPNGNTLYVSCLSEMQPQSNVPLFFVVDISNVQQPEVIARVLKTGFTSDLIFSPSHTLSLDGNTLYVAANEGTYNETGGGGFLAAYNVSNPASPIQMWKRQFQYGGGFANEVVLDQSTGRIFVAYDGGVRSFAVNQFGIIDEALVSAAGMTNGVAVSADGKHAFVMEQDLLAVYAQNEKFSVSVDIASAPEPVFTPVESEGLVTLNKDSSGKLYADSMPIYDIAGNHISTNHLSGWTTLGAEDIAGEKLLLWEHEIGELYYWKMDGSWRYQTGFGQYYDGSVDYYLAETRFGIDVNNDGTVGAPVTAPIAPINLIAEARDGEVSLTWDAPLSDGGTAITGYALSYQAGGGGWVTGNTASLNYTVLELTNSVSYDFRVAAINVVGQGPWSTTVSIEGTPVNNTPTIDPLSDLVLPEDSLTQVIDITGITAGGSETQPLRVTATTSNPSLIPVPSITDRVALGIENRLLGFMPLPNQYGIATITVTVEDGGLDLNLETAEDNATFSQAFDVTVTPDTDDPPSLVTPHGNMFIHQTLSGDLQASYQLPAVNVNGEAINGLLNRITVTSSNTALIPDPTVLYASADVPSSLSFTPLADANGTATLSIQVEDGGPDNDFATTEGNRQATHQVEVNVLEVISNQNSAILAKDSSENLYVNTQPVVYHDHQQAQSTIAGFAVIGATSESGGNALLVERNSATNRLVTDDVWRINGLFNSLQNESSSVLDLSAREVSGILNIAAVAGAYEINGVNNPTLIVRRGQTYTFNLNTAGHRFWLQTTGSGYQSANVYDSEFTGNSQTTGEHQWVVPEDAPDEIFYQCEFHPEMFGKIIIVD